MERSTTAPNEIYLKTPEEMAARFRHLPEALSNTLRVAEMCGGRVEPAREADAAARSRCPRARPRRTYFGELSRRRGSSSASTRSQALGTQIDRAVYRDAARDRARRHRRRWASPGTSSSSGTSSAGRRSTACRSVRAAARARARSSRTRCGITDLDPIPYGLLFERFLNPERVSMPDFDVDFCMDGARPRHRVRARQVRRARASVRSRRSTCSRAGASCATSGACMGMSAGRRRPHRDARPRARAGQERTRSRRRSSKSRGSRRSTTTSRRSETSSTPRSRSRA